MYVLGWYISVEIIEIEESTFKRHRFVQFIVFLKYTFILKLAIIISFKNDFRVKLLNLTDNFNEVKQIIYFCFAHKSDFYTLMCT